MKKNNIKGFTLIELLAVIVILAVIALIATPIILDLIENTRESADKESINMYKSAVQNALARYQMMYPQADNITFNDLVEKNLIDYTGNEVTCGEITLTHGVVEGIDKDNCKVTRREVTPGEENPGETAKTICTKSSTQNFDDTTAYECEVATGKTYTFYVLSEEGDKVNLILDRNVTVDGVPTDERQDNDEWYVDDRDNSFGPTTAFIYLESVSSNWTNLPNISINYVDEGHTANASYGYGSIVTSGTTTIITKADGTESGTYENLKARLPKESEVVAKGCHVWTSRADNGSCPLWLVDYLASSDSYTSSLKHNASDDDNWGYWLMSSIPGLSHGARRVNNYGSFFGIDTNYEDFGVRPVITLLKSNLSN